MAGCYGGVVAGIAALLLLGRMEAPGESPAQKRISLEEGRKLVYAIVAVHDPNHEVDISRVDNPYDVQFYYFEASWPNPAGSPHLGNFAVNPWTGDVFNADGCERLTSPSLKKLQDAIRKRSRLTREEYVRLRAKKPICGKD
jgi:hypothetical protein